MDNHGQTDWNSAHGVTPELEGTGRDGESRNLEWKLSWRDHHLKWTCGCTNTQGAVLVIGKNDRGGMIGMKEPLRLLEDVPNTTRSLLGIVTDVTIKSEQAREYLDN